MLLNINLNLNNMNIALNNNTIDKEFDAFMVNFIASEESIVSQQAGNDNVITAFVKKYQKSLNQVN